MARIVKKKKAKKRFSLAKFSIVLFMVTGLLYVCSTLFLRTYNNSLSSKKQAIDVQIAALESQNKETEMDITSLASSTRINEVAASEGLKYNQENITTISPKQTDGE